MTRPRSKAAMREMDAEARSMALLTPVKVIGRWRGMVTFQRPDTSTSTLTEEDFDLEFVAMKQQDSLPLKEQPIKGEPPADDPRRDRREQDRGRHEGRPVTALTPATTQEIYPMASAPNVPMTQDKARDLGKPFEPVAEKFAAAIADLGRRPLTRQTVELAKEFDVEAIRYLKDLESSELRRQTDSAFQLHRFLTGVLNKLKSPAESLRSTCSTVIYRFNQAERQRIADEQRAREAAIRKQQQEERAAERAALEAAGATEEVQVLDATPLPPVVAPPAREETRIEGVSIVTKCKLKRVVDWNMFVAKVIAPNPSMLPLLFKSSDSDFTKWLTSQMDKASGQLSIKPEEWGIEVEFQGGTRHRSGE